MGLLVHNQSILQRIRQKYRLAILLIAVMVTLSSLSLFFYLNEQGKFAYYINLTGKQRMLSQKISLHAEQILHPSTNAPHSGLIKRIQIAADELHSNYNILSRDPVLFLLDGERYNQAEQLYFIQEDSIKRLLTDYLLDVEHFIKTNAATPKEYQILFQHDKLELLLSNLDQIVLLYQAQSEYSITKLKLINMVFWLLTLLILMAELRYIFKPLLNKITKNFCEIETQSRQLKHAQQKSEHANHLKTQLLANISHEVRTPLNGVLGMLHIMQSRQKYEQEYIRKAQQSALDLLEILDFILNFSDLEQELIVLQTKPFILTELLSQTLLKHQQACKEKGLFFELSIAPDVPNWINSDSKALGLIIGNLLSNAVKFTEFGGVSINLRFSSEHSGQLILQVKDTGIGISDEMLTTVYDPFHQESSGFERKYSGCGIGLSIVKKLIDLFEGNIQISSQLGKGTLVNIIIPIDYCQTQPRLSSESLALIENKNFTLISDNPALVHHIRQIFIQFNVSLTILTELSPEKVGKLSGRILFDMALLSSYSTFEIPSHWVLLNAQKQATADSTNSDFVSDVLPAFLTANQLLHYLADANSQLNFLNNWPGRRVLVAEDNEINQDVIRNILEQAELEVVLANDGVAALNLVQTQYFDLILMDVQMPNMDGLAATKKIRALTDFKQPPIVALTAHALRTDEQDCYDAGMDDFLTKPINAQKLFAVLRRFLG